MKYKKYVMNVISLLGVLVFSDLAPAQHIKLLEQKHDPHGFPRPGRGHAHVPLRTSFYLELGTDQAASPDVVRPETVSIRLQPEGGEACDILQPGQKFAAGFSGRLFPRRTAHDKESLAVSVDTEADLLPSTLYTIRVKAESSKAETLLEDQGTWTFTTEVPKAVHPVQFALNLQEQPVQWRGAFFSGFCNICFCTGSDNFLPTYELMNEARKEHPRAWSLQRDFWLTGTEHQPKFLSGHLPNAVRERETRRIGATEHRPEGIMLKVEDVFGHQQYGIPSGRPLSEDYHAGDQVLIADGIHDARAKVLATDDQAQTVLVSSFETPPGGWRIEYAGPLPKREDPDAPGLFPPGGCYLRRLEPHGTPCYYWGRVDKEWDGAHRTFGRRLMPNFADAPGDLARDGRSWTTAKDYAEWHEVVRTMTGHVIDRYGEDSLDFVWSVFNEPDLGPLFWRADWNELQTFYDYTVDAILRAFEERGYNSHRVFVGGLELGGIFGTNLKLREFLAHCSPRADAPGAMPKNAAVADKRLDGKRSNRVETLCRAHEGKGSPCDFISIHSYNRSEIMAAKLARAKQLALEIDPDYYQALWVNSHESCPEWAPPPDPAAADSYLGNGYFPTWCADVAWRQLRQAAGDARYAYGETILTFWPPNQNFGGANACTRIINCDDNGDGQTDRKVTVPMPIFHVLGLLSEMGDRYWVLPVHEIGGHRVTGFASRNDRGLQILLYSHNNLDTQSRSDAEFDVALDLSGLAKHDVRVREYRFDKDNNSYYRLARTLRDRPAPRRESRPEPAELETAIRSLGSDDPQTAQAALKTLGAFGSAAQEALQPILKLIEETKDDAVRSAAHAAVGQIAFPTQCYAREDVERVQALATCRATNSAARSLDADNHLRLTARVAGNGLNFVTVEPQPNR